MASTLSDEEVLKRSRATCMSSVRQLNCWGCGLTDVSVLASAGSLEILNLSCNQLASVTDLINCICLQELFLRKNVFTDFAQLKPLQQLRKLKVLWLSDNPVTSLPGYRSTVIHMLPQLSTLDNLAITAEERREAQNSAAIHKKSNILSAVLCLLPVLSRQELQEVERTATQFLSRD